MTQHGCSKHGQSEQHGHKTDDEDDLGRVDRVQRHQPSATRAAVERVDLHEDVPLGAHDDDEYPRGGVHKNDSGGDDRYGVAGEKQHRYAGVLLQEVRARRRAEGGAASELRRCDRCADDPVEDDDGVATIASEERVWVQRVQKRDHLGHGEPGQAVQRVERETPHEEHLHVR